MFLGVVLSFRIWPERVSCKPCRGDPKNSPYPRMAAIWGFPKIKGTFWGPNNKDYSILGSILGSPNFGKLPYHVDP